MHLTYRRSFTKDMNALPRGPLRNELIDILQYLEEIDSVEELLAYSLVKKLDGYSMHYRVRVDNYRLGFRLENNDNIILLRFRHRSEIYKNFP